MYEKENNMKNITQSVLSEQLPSATNSARFVPLEGEDIHLQAEKQYSRAPFPPWTNKASVC